MSESVKQVFTSNDPSWVDGAFFGPCLALLSVPTRAFTGCHQKVRLKLDVSCESHHYARGHPTAYKHHIEVSGLSGGLGGQDHVHDREDLDLI